MHARSRFRVLRLQRLLQGSALVVLLVLSGTWGYLQFDTRTLAGIRVAGEPLPRVRDPRATLAQRSAAWGARRVSIMTGPNLTTATREELGAHLEVEPVALRALRLGHSGDPLADVWAAGEAWARGVDMLWPPHIDRIRLGRYMRAIRNRVERPPVAGTVDETGVSFAGAPGVTLDVIGIADLVERALRAGELRVSMPLRNVDAPKALAIGSPDGVDDKDLPGHEPSLAGQSMSVADAAQMSAAMPGQWLPSQGCEPMDPPYDQYCQGPRRVPLPFGAAAERAERLGLGTLKTVGKLLNSAPRPDWVAAAGGPVPAHPGLQWPAPRGRLTRRFGYVRRPPFENLLHRGVDIGAPAGTPLVAAHNGIVAYSDNRVRGYGNLLVIVHDDGSVSFSAHCRAIYMFAGQPVRRGQIVGEVGDTGLARGSHVHWEYHVHGAAVDPDGLFEGR